MAKKKTSAKKKEEIKEQSQNSEEQPVDEHAKQNRMKSFYVRTVSTIAMLGGFILILSLGHAYCALLVVFLLILGFKELKALKRRKEMDKNIPWFNVINWYFFV